MGDGDVDCDECRVEGYRRLMALRDYLDAVLWSPRSIDPVEAVDRMRAGLVGAGACFRAASNGGPA